MIPIDQLPFDVLRVLFDSFDDRPSLYACVLVSRIFKDAALPALYHSVDLRDRKTDEIGSKEFLALRTLEGYPYLRPYVRVVRQWAHPPQAGFNLEFGSLSKLCNLSSYTLHALPGTKVSSELWTVVVEALLQCPKLIDLHLLFNVGSDNFPSLSLLKNIRSVTLGRPTRHILAHIGSWMDNINSVESLSILDATKIDPWTIVPLLPHLTGLKSFVLGRHHKLWKVSLLEVSAKLPNLEYLDIYYDNFLNDGDGTPWGFPRPHLSRLQDLIVRHQGVGLRTQFDVLHRWMQSLASSSDLKSLAVISDDSKECKWPNILLGLIVRNPGLRTLKIPNVELREMDLKVLFSRCPKIETLSFYMSETSLLKPYLTDGEVQFPAENLSVLSWRIAWRDRTPLVKLRKTLILKQSCWTLQREPLDSRSPGLVERWILFRAPRDTGIARTGVAEFPGLWRRVY